MLPLHPTLLLCLIRAARAAIPLAVPGAPPDTGVGIVPAPVGASFEFFAWPAYTALPATSACLANLAALSGAWPPVRIGGTTQTPYVTTGRSLTPGTRDRAHFDPAQGEAVAYYVATPEDAPANLTFGPAFLALAAGYAGEVIIGLNRRLDNLTNTIAAARAAVDVMPNLRAVELGNEPDFYVATDPIAMGRPWTATADRASQVHWQAAVASALARDELVSAGVFFGVTTFNMSELNAVEGPERAVVRDYCSHNYPQSAPDYDLGLLMSHAGIRAQVEPFSGEAATARGAVKPYIFGETNSATGGGGGISPTFGAALWIVDYVMQSLLLGVQALYFHQGTIDDCQYCWWSNGTVNSPYYGAYFAALALANATGVAELDDGLTNYAAYAICADGRIDRLLLYNSDYYPNATAQRPSQTWEVSGLGGRECVSAVRLTAVDALAQQGEGEAPTVGGQGFANASCAVTGERVVERVRVENGRAGFTVGASEALLVYL